MSAPALLRRLLLNAPTLAGVALILLISLSFATQTIDWMKLNRTPTAVQSNQTSELAASPEPDSIATLFGSAAARNDTAPPATNLRLTLRGSFVDSNANKSSAIIQREGSKPQRFAIGAQIDNGVRLHAVFRDRVEIERNGRRETLMFNKRAGAQGSTLPSQNDAVDDLSSLQQQDEQHLRDQMEALRQQMENAGGQSAPEPAYEAEPPAAPQSSEPLPSDPPTESE